MYFPDMLYVMDFSLTHRILLLRMTEIVGITHQNTDLLFESTFYVELPVNLYGATLSLGIDEDVAYVRSRCDEEISVWIEPREVFVLTAFDRKYYIGAGRLQVLHNTYLGGETSIGAKRTS
jgi:hypothetical protein